MTTYTVESPEKLLEAPQDPCKELVLIEDRILPDMKTVYLQGDLDGSQWTMVASIVSTPWVADLHPGDKLLNILKSNNCTEMNKLSIIPN